ncbi:MAG: hypothetical protein EXX96DRAFT_538025 [Benjaminiella poitrasii]|nr:MAG: hypothetical protein EXX96DRAFT_538025 [Benjaminiella poitrasii]
MNRVIGYSLSAYCRYKAYPIVLMFAIKGFLSVDIEKEFSCVDESPFLKIQSKFWAKDCILILPNSIDKFLSRSPMEPIVALGYYLIAGSLSLDSLEYRLDPTIKRQLEHAVDEDKGTRNLAVKKIKECVNESLELISEQNEFLTTDSDQGEIKDNKYTKQYILFIISNSTVGKN